MEKIILTVSFGQWNQHSSGGMGGFAPDAPSLDDYDTHSGLSQPPGDRTADYAAADDRDVNLFARLFYRLGHLCRVRRGVIGRLALILFTHPTRVIKMAIGRIDFVIDY